MAFSRFRWQPVNCGELIQPFVKFYKTSVWLNIVPKTRNQFNIGCKGNKSPTPRIYLTHVYFRPPKHFHCWSPFPQRITIDALYICWFYWRNQKWLTFTSKVTYNKWFPGFKYNLSANGENCNVYIDNDLLPWLRFSEKQILWKNFLGKQNI